jgi:hypothetical protein
MQDMFEAEKVAAFMEKGVVEVAPLAFMRGRTLNDSFVILDEAQNTTPEQMKMFLTRLGFNSKMVITGDITQVDLPRDQQSGLVVVNEILRDVEGIDFIRFTGEDVVRHRLVQRIVEAYADHAERSAPGCAPPPGGRRSRVGLDVEVIGTRRGRPPPAEVERLVGLALASAGSPTGTSPSSGSRRSASRSSTPSTAASPSPRTS